MKKLLILALVLSMGVAQAELVSPLPNLKPDLESMLQNSAGRKNLVEMKKVANDRNTDVDVAFENYLIAKKNISVARAQFNPITTGQLLGVAIGLSYFWAPIAIEAVTSIPTKIYNVSKNKYLSKVAYYNLQDARAQVNNELAHLYYDILTHEVILKTIDQESSILSYQEAKWVDRKFSPERIADLKKWELRLGMERVDIYNMYVAELAAIRTLISTTDGSKYELAQISTLLDKSITTNLDQGKLQDFSVINSDKYKASINLHRASIANVKQVQWSILSFAGLNFSYKRRIKDAKNEENIADLRQQSTELEVRTNVLLQLNKLDSSLDVLSNYNSISTESLQMYADTYESFQMGQLSEDSAIETALGAIRDFRSKVVAHYAAWSALDDFSNSANFDVKEAGTVASAPVQGQIETNPLYQLEAADFKVVRKDVNGSTTLLLSSPKIGTVSSVDYVFSTSGIADASSDNGKKNYSVMVAGSPAKLAGTAMVKLDNGHEFSVKFDL
ncbi:MAG: TolC family protein [Rhizobacter sp.]|nr:TolC family protein [Bacteriovorax sp.]